jgi:xanthine dehydrogenase accessory factor
MDFLEQIAALRREGQPFAVATVVGRRAPVSAHLGDRAIVYADGRMEGFVGGACSREIIRAQALDTLQTRHPRLVSIRSDSAERLESTPEHVLVPMTCVSEGGIDVYVEPFVQPRRLIVVGATPVADALTRLARGMDYDVVHVVEAQEQRDIGQRAAALGVTTITLDTLDAMLRDGAAVGLEHAAVVASQGHYDEEALESVLKSGVPYVGLVASRKRGGTVRSLLEKKGVPGVAAIRNPAGLDLGAKTSTEVALSILAEIVQTQARRPQLQDARGTTAQPAATAAATTAVDPVCGMSVTIASARHTANVDDVAYYFCCANCRDLFAADPARYRAHTT